MIACSDRTYARNVGGNSRYIRIVADGLRDRGADIQFFSPSNTSSMRWAAYEGLVLQAEARRKGAEAVWYPADTGPIRARRGIRTIVTLHGVAALHEPSVRNPVSGAIWKRRALQAARAAETIITVSHSSADDIATLAGDGVSDRVAVIHHGIGKEWFDAPDPATLQTLAPVFAEHPLYALYYGNLEPRKNLPLALEALELVRAEHPDLRFIVSGAPAWESDEIVAELERRDWVTYLGRRSDEEIRALLSRCAFFVFPSRYEGFGFPVLEAMAAGAPVVATNRGALAEVMGDQGFVIESLDAEDLARACVQALAADRDAVAARGRAYAASFSWDESIARHRDVLGV